MLKTIALILLILGLLLIVLAAVLFFLTGCLEAIKNLRQTKLVTGSSYQMPNKTVTDIYYETQADLLVNKPKTKTEKKQFVRHEGFVPQNDSALLVSLGKNDGDVPFTGAETTGLEEHLSSNNSSIDIGNVSKGNNKPPSFVRVSAPKDEPHEEPVYEIPPQNTEMGFQTMPLTEDGEIITEYTVKDPSSDTRPLDEEACGNPTQELTGQSSCRETEPLTYDI